MRAYAYARVSTEEQSVSGLGVDAQLAAAHGAIEARGWTLAGSVIDAAVSGAVAPDRRGALGPALAVLDAGDADALVVARLDRLTRSLLAWAELVQRSQCQDWVIVAVAEGFDLSSPSGRAFAGMLAVMSEYERELIASRIREAMAAAKARGVRLGRPVEHSPAVRALVVQMRESGATLQKIADRLTDDQVATPRGGRWHLATVKRILDSHRLDIEAADTAARIESEALLAAETFEPEPV